MCPDNTNDERLMTTLNPALARMLKRLHYPLDVILICVRWYVAYPLSLRHLAEVMAERGISVDHSTVHRWAIRVLPVLEKAFRHHKKALGRSWRMDETYIKVRGQWKYLHRAVDREGNAVNFLLRTHRDKAAARRYFEKSIEQNGEPETVTIDKSGANLAALDAINAERETLIKIRQNKFLSNVVEQDHRAIKRRTRPILGFKDFRCARILLSGIELMHMTAKGQMQDRGIGYAHPPAVLITINISNPTDIAVCSPSFPYCDKTRATPCRHQMRASCCVMLMPRCITRNGRADHMCVVP